MTDDIAIAHKDYDVRGGGERLAEQLALGFDAPLYVGRFDLSNAATELGIDFHELAATRWQKKLIDHGGLPRSLAYYFVWQHESSALADYDTVILSGNEPLWYVGPDEQTVVAYTHSTPRWFYDLFHTIDRDGIGSLAWRLVIETQRVWYDAHVRRPDLFVCNSELVARRVRKYWNIPAEQVEVVHPPVAVDEYDPDDAPDGDYFLYLGRVTDTKRVPWLAKHADVLPGPLKIAGRGPALESVRDHAGDGVDVLGYVSEQRKRELLAGARALVMPAMNEDFGMVPIEAFAAGTPVLGVNDGFTKYQVRDGENGRLFDVNRQSFAAVCEAFDRDGVAWDADEIAAFAQQFGTGRFHDEMRSVVEQARESSRVEAAHGTPPAAGADSDGGSE